MNTNIKMDFKSNSITSVILTDTTIEVIYDDENNTNEILQKNKDTYKNMHDEWLLEQKMFISDIFKNEMINLNFACYNNENSIQELNSFFSPGNEEKVLKFLNYMRTRDLTFEKQKWKFNNS